jgi:hypothetical protein
MSADWMTAAAAMAAVLERENALLSALDLGGAAALLGEKERALGRLTEAAAPDGSAATREVALRLAGLAESNRALLERGMAAQERVVARVMDAARAVRRAAGRDGGRYTPGGGLAEPGGAAVALSARV